MSFAIQVDSLSKLYRIGHRIQRYDTLRDVLSDKLRLSSFRSLKHQNNETSLWALKDVSFEIRPGEVVGIIGRNGAGKSTLLKVLSRITEPTSGRAIINGRVGSLLEVGTGFHPELTGRENIYLNGAILGMSRQEINKKFDEIVSFSEIERFLDTPVKRYSSGMYVRLAFAVAAHLEPEILLVDEVLAVGDAAFQKKCLGKMGDVAKEGRTVLFVSHNMTAMKSLCKRAMWLDKGNVVGIGEVMQVVSGYLQRGFFSILEQVWNDPEKAPGNEHVRIHSAHIILHGLDITDEITVETPLEMEFEIWNNTPGMVLNFTIHLYTAEGIYVLAAGSDAKPRHHGVVKGNVKIPPNFLNDNLYTVTLQIVKDTSSTLYLYPDILVFEVHDAARAGNWFGKWPGVIRPQLEWSTKDVKYSENY